MEETKKIIMFDFDGVLIDTLFVWYEISSQVNHDMDIEEYKTFFDGNIHDAVRKNGQPRNIDPHFAHKFAHLTREMKVPEVLQEAVAILALKYTLVVVSSTPSDLIAEILERERIRDCFELLLGADIHKSKVVKIGMVMERYQTKPEECVFITDTLGDIREATKCNVPSVAVTWGFHERKNLEKGNPRMIIDDPKMLVASIESVLE
jgi:phosphoglycolate phosphatase